MSDLLRRFAAYSDIPEYVVVGLSEPQQEIKVELRGLGIPRDVTFNHSLAAMRPVTISIGLDPSEDLAAIENARWSLVFLERGSRGTILGEIGLRFLSVMHLPMTRVGLFEATGCKNSCLSLPALILYYIRQAWRNFRKARPDNFHVPLRQLHCIYVFYICPRPVVLVTVMHGESGNIFPMDLIGYVSSGYFLMALRSTSPSVETISLSREMVLSSIPPDYKNVAYDLGKHHRKKNINWNSLEFPVRPSPLLALPMPATALRVREVRVEKIQEVGSHTLFTTTIVNEESYSSNLQMFHIHGTYARYLKRTSLVQPDTRK